MRDRARWHARRPSLLPRGRVPGGRKESVEAGRLHLDIVRDLKRVNSHLAAAAYPILEGQGELLPSRLKQD